MLLKNKDPAKLFWYTAFSFIIACSEIIVCIEKNDCSLVNLKIVNFIFDFVNNLRSILFKAP